MRERLMDLRADVLELKHRAAEVGDGHTSWVWYLLYQVLGIVLESGVV